MSPSGMIDVESTEADANINIYKYQPVSWILQCHLIDIYQGTISYTGNHVIPAQWYYITSLSGVTIPHLHLLGIENLWWKHHRPVEAIDMFGRKNPHGFPLNINPLKPIHWFIDLQICLVMDIDGIFMYGSCGWDLSIFSQYIILKSPLNYH